MTCFKVIVIMLFAMHKYSVIIAAAPVSSDGRKTDLFQNGSNTEHHLSQRSLQTPCGPPKCPSNTCEFMPGFGCKNVCCLCNPKDTTEFDFLQYCMDQPINKFYNETRGLHYFCQTMHEDLECEQASLEPTPMDQYGNSSATTFTNMQPFGNTSATTFTNMDPFDNTSATIFTNMYPFGNTSATTFMANLTSQEPVIDKNEKDLPIASIVGGCVGALIVLLVPGVVLIVLLCKCSRIPKCPGGRYVQLENPKSGKKLEPTPKKVKTPKFKNDFYIKSGDDDWAEDVMNHLTGKGFKGVSDQKDIIGGVSKFELFDGFIKSSRKIIISIDQLDLEKKYNVEYALQEMLENPVDNRLILVKLKENSEVPACVRNYPPLNAWDEDFLDQLQRSVGYGWKIVETDAEEEGTAFPENGWNCDGDDTKIVGKETEHENDETAEMQRLTNSIQARPLHYSKGGIGVCENSDLKIEVKPFPLIKGEQKTVTLTCYTTKGDDFESVKISHTKGDMDAQRGKEIDMQKSGQSYMLTIDPFTEQNAGMYIVDATDREEYVSILRFDLKFYNKIEELLEDCPLTLNKVLDDHNYQEILKELEPCLKENFEGLFRHLTGKPSGEWRESSVSESAQSAIQSIASQNDQLNLSHVLQCLHVQMQRNEAVLGVEKYHKDCVACGFFYNLAHQVA